jgi:hypothetical protein
MSKRNIYDLFTNYLNEITLMSSNGDTYIGANFEFFRKDEEYLYSNNLNMDMEISFFGEKFKKQIQINQLSKKYMKEQLHNAINGICEIKLPSIDMPINELPSIGHIDYVFLQNLDLTYFDIENGIIRGPFSYGNLNIKDLLNR